MAKGNYITKLPLQWYCSFIISWCLIAQNTYLCQLLNITFKHIASFAYRIGIIWKRLSSYRMNYQKYKAKNRWLVHIIYSMVQERKICWEVRSRNDISRVMCFKTCLLYIIGMYLIAFTKKLHSFCQKRIYFKSEYSVSA